MSKLQQRDIVALVVCPAFRESKLSAFSHCKQSLLAGGFSTTEVRRVAGVNKARPPPGFVEKDADPKRMLSAYFLKNWLQRARRTAIASGASYVAWVEDDCELLGTFDRRGLEGELKRAGQRPLWAGWYPLKGTTPSYGTHLVLLIRYDATYCKYSKYSK